MDSANEVFAISELRAEILAYCTGATLHPLKVVSRAWDATICEIMAAQLRDLTPDHTWTRCHQSVAVNRGCIECIKYAVVESGVNLGSVICGLCEHGYYGLALILTPKLQFESKAISRQYYNAVYTLLANVDGHSVDQLRAIFGKQRGKLPFDPDYVWLWNIDYLFVEISARRIPTSSLVKWIARGNHVIDDQIAFADRIIHHIDYILVAPNVVFVNIVCAIFERGLNVAAMRVLESVAPFYCVDHGADLITASIAAPGGCVELFMAVCEFLRDYRLTQDRFYRYMTTAIVAGKYNICVELRKIAIVCGLRHYLTYTQSPLITTQLQARCANVFERSHTCTNVLNGIITATEYTAHCPLTTQALIAGLAFDSTQHYRRATYLSVLWSSALDQLSMTQKYIFYYMLNLTPTSLTSLLTAYNGLTMRAISIDLYALYIEYGPHVHSGFYTTLYHHADCDVSRVLLGMLANIIPEITDEEIDSMWISRYDLLLRAAIRLRKTWWLERLWRCDETIWERLRAEQITISACVFYIPDKIKARMGRKKRKTYSTRNQPDRKNKRRRITPT